MRFKGQMIAAALLGIAGGSFLPTAGTAHAGKAGHEKCWGINKCGAHTKCGVDKGDLKAANEAFNNKYKGSKLHACGGMGNCAAAKNQLGWVYVKEGTCLKEKGGFLIKGKGDKKKVVKK